LCNDRRRRDEENKARDTSTFLKRVDEVIFSE
jgi:hypothetical protein